MEIRKANLNDTVDILACHNYYVLGQQWSEPAPNSFFLEELKESVVVSYIQNNSMDVFTLVDEKGFFSGYSIISHCPEDDLFSPEHYIESPGKLPETFYYLKQIGIHPSKRRQGFAQKMMEFIIGFYPGEFLCSHVTIKPIENTASISLHQKNGFVVTGIYRAPSFKGLSPYESYFFTREDKP